MNDLISRAALCEYALNQKDKSITANDIMRFPPAQQWIPCSVQLPETGHNYLYCTDMGTVHMGFYWDGLGFEYGFEHGYDIVAWMPLPEPYKGLNQHNIESVIQTLPSAQPENIRCRKCMHWEEYMPPDQKKYHYCHIRERMTHENFHCEDARKRREMEEWRMLK